MNPNEIRPGITLEGVTIQESTTNLTFGRTGKIAVLMYVGEKNPVEVLDEAVSIYVDYEQYFQFIDIHMDNPWLRVVMSDLNDMQQEAFDPSTHRLKNRD